MKTWNALTKTEQEEVIRQQTIILLYNMWECPDYSPEIYYEAMEAGHIAELNKTPWFFAEILYNEIKGAKAKIDKIVRRYCESAFYLEPGEHIINCPVRGGE